MNPHQQSVSIQSNYFMNSSSITRFDDLNSLIQSDSLTGVILAIACLTSITISGITKLIRAILESNSTS